MNKNISQKPPFWFYLVLFFIPFIIIFLLEIGLRIADYGNDYQTWTSISSSQKILNPEIARKYFSNTKNIPFATEAFVDKIKSEKGLRIFVLGGSSAAGYPYLSSASFSKYIRKGLQIAYPQKRIEVVNFSMSAINSYTLKDLMPDLLKDQPDAIVIYAGHNEYYGALGVASTESMGSVPFLIDLMLTFDDLKIVQLVKNIITKIFSAASDTSTTEKTLMAKVSKDKLVPYKSENFQKGIEQFRDNMEKIIELASDENIPVYISTLVSNLKDQEPLISIEQEKFPSADSVYKSAHANLGNITEAESLFVYAKELDALRFRAPEQMNKTIIDLSRKFNCRLIRSDLMFKNYSGIGIIGNELMTDHLHLNVKGYQLLGRFFLEEILKNEKVDFDQIDKLILEDYNFTKYDSVTADFRIRILKNDWPFNKSGNMLSEKELLNPKDLIEETAYKVIKSTISRKEARENIASYYFKNGNIDLFVKEKRALKEEFPFMNVNLVNESKIFLQEKKYDQALSLLKESFKMSPDAFSAKWIGIILLSKKQFTQSVEYLNRSLSYNPNDSQVLFNLAGAYSDLKNYESALTAVEKCLLLDPNNKNAKSIRSQLKRILDR